MGKFLLGLVTGAVLIILVLVVGFFAIASLRSKPPAVADGSTLVLRLSGDVPEKPPIEIPLPILEDRTTLTVENVWSMLRRAASDSRIKAVIFEPESAGIGWAKMQEIHHDLQEFRKSGKPLYAFLKSPGTREYYMATACSRIYMEPVDTLNLKGIGLELMYFKNTLDKLGVQVDVEHAGKYKDFGDMFTKTSMSPETKEVMNSIADDVYGDLVNTIAKGRGKDAATIRATIDRGPFLSNQAQAAGLVDALRFEDEMQGELKSALRQTELKKIAARDYVSAADTAPPGSDRVAFVVAEGSITRGDPDSSSDNGLERDVARHERTAEKKSRGDFHVGCGRVGWILHGDVRGSDRGLSGDRNRVHRGGLREAQSPRTLRQNRHHQGFGEPRQIRNDRFGLSVHFGSRTPKASRGHRFRLSGLRGEGGSSA